MPRETLKRGHTLRGKNLIPLIRTIRRSTANPIDLACIDPVRATEKMSLEEMEDIFSTLTGETMEDILEMAGRDVTMPNGQLLIHHAVIFANEVGQPSEQDLVDTPITTPAHEVALTAKQVTSPCSLPCSSSSSTPAPDPSTSARPVAAPGTSSSTSFRAHAAEVLGGPESPSQLPTTSTGGLKCAFTLKASEINHKVSKALLQNNRMVLVDNGDLINIKDQLLQDEILTVPEIERLELPVHSRGDKMSKLVDILVLKPGNHVVRFFESLEKADRLLYSQLDMSPEKTRRDDCSSSEPMSPPGARALCDPHKRQIIMFCGKCDVALCKRCLKESHSRHEIMSIEDAVMEKKGFLESRMSSWADKKHSLEEARDRLYSLNDELEKASDQRIAEINNRYEKLHQRHEMRRQEEITKVKSSKGKSSNKILGPAHAADSKLEKMADTHKRFVELSRSDESFVKEATDLAKR